MVKPGEVEELESAPWVTQSASKSLLSILHFLQSPFRLPLLSLSTKEVDR